MGNAMNHLSSLQKEEWQWEKRLLTLQRPPPLVLPGPGQAGKRGKGAREMDERTSPCWRGFVCKTAAGSLSEQPGCQLLLILLLTR